MITITSPGKGQVYSQDVQLTYSITDTDFASAWYTINNGTKTTINQNGTIPLTLADGLYKIVIGATDQKPQSVRDSVSFEINRPPEITITTPIDGTVYDKDIQLIYNISDTDYELAWYSRWWEYENKYKSKWNHTITITQWIICTISDG